MPEAGKNGAQVQDAPAPTNSITVTLDKQVIANGEPVKELTFREPTGGDLMLVSDGGWPVKIDYETGVVTPNGAVMGMMMSSLAQVPPSTIKSLSSKDFTNCAHKLMGFFVPDARGTPS